MYVVKILNALQKCIKFDADFNFPFKIEFPHSFGRVSQVRGEVTLINLPVSLIRLLRPSNPRKKIKSLVNFHQSIVRANRRGLYQNLNLKNVVCL